MAQLVVRDLEDDVKAKLRRRAAAHGCSMEEEVRAILRDAVREPTSPSGGWAARLRRYSKDRLDQEIPELRGFQPNPAKFD